jgi:uncharacterized membrane protein
MKLKTKPFYQSSTLWINALGIVIIVLEFVLTTNLIPDAEVVALVVAILNILNRFRVVKPLDVKTLTLK